VAKQVLAAAKCGGPRRWTRERQRSRGWFDEDEIVDVAGKEKFFRKTSVLTGVISTCCLASDQRMQRKPKQQLNPNPPPLPQLRRGGPLPARSGPPRSLKLAQYRETSWLSRGTTWLRTSPDCGSRVVRDLMARFRGMIAHYPR
jgi:hypothetical protein